MAKMEEATFVCAEHGCSAHHFDSVDFDADVTLARNTKIIDTSSSDAAPSAADAPDDKQACTFKVTEPGCDKPHPLFGWQDSKTIKKTFKSATQCARMPRGTILAKLCKSPFPALNVKRHDEPVATDAISVPRPLPLMVVTHVLRSLLAPRPSSQTSVA